MREEKEATNNPLPLLNKMQKIVGGTKNSINKVIKMKVLESNKNLQLDFPLISTNPFLPIQDERKILMHHSPKRCPHSGSFSLNYYFITTYNNELILIIHILIYIELQYLLETSAYPREHQQLKELRQATVDKYQHLYVVALHQNLYN